jgi:hypothetical protein
LNEIQYQRGKYFYFLGKLDQWGASGFAPTTDIPNTQQADQEIRSSIVYAKKIGPSDVSLVIPRYNWTEGVVYDEWDNTVDMREKKFYVVTDELQVYKCLDNASNSASMHQPIGTSISPFRTADGYLWKYMYTIPVSKRNKFAGQNYIPVQQALSESFYNNGAVSDATVLFGGSGYTSNPATTLSLSNTTTGAGASVTSLDVDPLGRVVGVVGLVGGSGYNNGVRISITSATGSGAVLEAVIVAGVVTNVNVVSSGIGYHSTDVVNFLVGQAQLLAVVSATTGSLVDVKIIDAGIGYATPPAITVVSATGNGIYGNLEAIVEAVVHEGSIKRVNIVDPGENYESDSTVTISVQGNGSGARFTPVVFNGSIIDVIVEEPGSGYSTINLTVQANLAPGGAPAIIRGVVSTSDVVSDQSVIEQTTIPGAIYNIKVTNGGSGYSAGTTVSVVGTGTGCVATPTIIGGVITKITVTEFGSEYNRADIVFTDPERLDENTITNKATAYACLSPYGGHGFDATTELYADTLVVSTTLINEVNEFDISQDFRYYGLLKNPRNLLSGVTYTGLAALCLFKCKFTSVTGMVEDEVLLLGQNKYRVAEIYPSTSEAYLQPLDDSSISPIGQFIALVDSNRTFQSTQVYNAIDFDKYSGKLLYASAESPFSFSGGQFTTFKTYIKF